MEEKRFKEVLTKKYCEFVKTFSVNENDGKFDDTRARFLRQTITELLVDVLTADVMAGNYDFSSC